MTPGTCGSRMAYKSRTSTLSVPPLAVYLTMASGVKMQISDEDPPPYTNHASGVTGNTAGSLNFSTDESSHRSGYDTLDILSQMKGVHRLLDLYSELGSGGLVEKIIIDQEGLRSLINDITPGSYHSLTRIDFAKLDLSSLKILGLYGSKTEIVRSLLLSGVIDETIARLLALPFDEKLQFSQASLRSGIYFAFAPNNSERCPSPTSPREAFVIYWPEETTWDDKAISAVQKNRTTFMRYLTRLCDQVVALISAEHESQLIWKDAETHEFDDFEMGELDDAMGTSDRFMGGEVVMQKEQEDGFSTAPGFKVTDPRISPCAEHALAPRLVSSECQQALVTAILRPAQVISRRIQQRYNITHLKSELSKYPKMHIHDDVTPEGLQGLIQQGGLEGRAKDLCEAFLSDIQNIKLRSQQESQATIQNIEASVETTRIGVRMAVCATIAKELALRFGHSDAAGLAQMVPDDYQTALAHWDHLVNKYPSLRDYVLLKLKPLELDIVSSDDYKRLKRRFLKVLESVRPDTPLQERKKLIQDLSINADEANSGGFINTVKKLNPFSSSSSSEVIDLPDPVFLNDLENVIRNEPLFTEPAHHLRDLAFAWAQNKIAHFTTSVSEEAEMELESLAKHQARKDIDLRTKEASDEIWAKFRVAFCEVVGGGASDTPCDADICITSVAMGRNHITMHAQARDKVDAQIEFRLNTLELTQDDRQHVQKDSQFIPRPKIRASGTFFLPLDAELKHVYMLPSNRCLIVVDSPTGISLYLSDLHSIARGPPTKHFPRSVQCDTIFALDELKHQFVMVVTDANSGTLTLHSFMFDERFSTIQSRRSPMDVTSWYQDGPPKIRSACFISGTEDLCLLEESGRLRIFSFLSQLFRNASVMLPRLPVRLFSAPDGSALIVVEPNGEDEFHLRTFHTSSFGSSNTGIASTEDLTFRTAHMFEVTSLEHRNNIHLISLSLSTNSLDSAILRISTKATTFQMQIQANDESPDVLHDTTHNSLIDCLAGVWTRYPVVPAIKRNLISSDTRMARSMTYITQGNHGRFMPYFKQMIRDFEKTTQKPTENYLDAISVQSFNLDTLIGSLTDEAGPFARTSAFKAGEWLTELLCLIPIHIAIARNNEFVPLNNGVIDPVLLEQRLLGADVPQIVDALKLGWYESIFNSYLATKPVKVVSSMGEQSVGKSYALNHFIDSSFAGSAIRTTEGVWLSVCPTSDLLIVALDFEGVHSIERSPQEDMLLVLFNTAISNMVLFRNNFALSREVANMFTSFQASTSSLDPASNPQLFKGQLVVIVKDVVDGDKKEIGQEFMTKLNQIVKREQATNFITLLHAGQYLIVPWPVVHSRAFYTLFSGLKIKFLRQATTHRTAGEFLQTLKTLMAKLKAKDWTTLGQTLTKHRVATLTTRLQTAIATGYAGLEPEVEPLRNFEDQSLIPADGDGTAQFCTTDVLQDIQTTLKLLISTWRGDAGRHNIQDLEKHLESLAEARIRHVGAWLTTNLQHLSQTNADVQALIARFRDACVRLRTNVLICSAKCTSCHLPCLLNNLHEQSDRRHDCGTSHLCLEHCYSEVHGEEIKDCGLSAGHTGRHMCDPTAHCCGAPCVFKGRTGCQDTCVQRVDHLGEDHTCSARVHQCGQPCNLKNLPDPRNLGYSCSGHCVIPHDEEHDRHACDSRSCPIKCELCLNTCTSSDHFHGLSEQAIHICRQDHRCTHLCAASGICEVSATPHKVETVFNGRYANFQYTKYTQSARRLPCAVPIPSGERHHTGDHVHSTEPDPFHHCETSCPSCGYICHLPFGHPQAEHETAHGSMDNTAWAIEGAADSLVEVQGHKYASQESGTPHMCNLVCSHQGRHAHIDYCRAHDPLNCREDDSLHIDVEMAPNPTKPKDWVSHSQFWKRSGFLDPYSKDEQADFALCDVQCGGEYFGPEHEADEDRPARPSFCNLLIFHAPHSGVVHPHHQGYVSSDGHSFLCANPNTLRQSFHVIFLLDISYSMTSTDQLPLVNTPNANIISAYHHNRLGAVLSALELFWSSRQAGVTGIPIRRDGYSVILFDDDVEVVVENDFTSTPDQLLRRLVTTSITGGTNFDKALHAAREVMTRRWSPDFSPVIIFLSDGECEVNTNNVYDLFDRAVALGTPLTFHAVSFGDYGYDQSLELIVRVGNQVGRNARVNLPASQPLCSLTTAINTIQLSDTFVDIAESLKKPRAGLMRARV